MTGFSKEAAGFYVILKCGAKKRLIAHLKRLLLVVTSSAAGRPESEADYAENI